MPDSLPSVVYHYTSMETLLKIVESKTIRATSIRYLNDISERDYAISEIGKRVTQHPKEIQTLFDCCFEKGDANGSFEDLPFVASFSGVRDSLSQWRSYCPNGNGVCIGFAVESLIHGEVDLGEERKRKDIENRWLGHVSTVFDPVQYLNSDSGETFDKVINELVKDALQEQKAWEESVSYEVDEEGRRSYGYIGTEQFVKSALDRVASHTKHDSFKAENEFRLVVKIWFASDRIEFRCSKSTLIPYVSVSLPIPNEFATPRKVSLYALPIKPFFIDSVTIGPTPNSKLTKQALEVFFQSRGHDVVIQESVIPYRDWL